MIIDTRIGLGILATAAIIAGCGGEREADRPVTWDTVQGPEDRVTSVTGLAGPEAVRYDPDQDVYFVANFNGDAAGDANGFISRVAPDGEVLALRFMQGTETAPLHGPRGMFITGDTLWAADANGVHGFDRRNGRQIAFVDFTPFEPGFLNDIAQGPEGALYVTDTGRGRVYRLEGGSVAIAADSTPNRPNGIAWDATHERFLLASWDSGAVVFAWYPAERRFEAAGPDGPGRHDGLEFVGERLLVASQQDSAIRVIDGGTSRVVIRVPGHPADIGLDTRRHRVAVPYIALNRVDIWEVPPPGE